MPLPGIVQSKRRRNRLHTSLPRMGKAAIRGYHLLKRRRSRPCEPIRSPSTVIPSAAERSLLHCRHMHTCALTQTTPWCFLFRLSLAHDLPLCKKDPSTSTLMTRKKNGSSHIVFHTALEHRPIKKSGEAATRALNPEPNESKKKGHLCRCPFMLISGLFLPAIPANIECKTKQKGPTIYMIDPF